MSIEKKTKPAGPQLWKKINAIQTEAEAVERDTDGVGRGGKTARLTSITAVLSTYLPLCKAHGISIVPVGKPEIVSSTREPDKYGRMEWNITAFVPYRAVDCETGEFHDFSVLSQGIDSNDKATGILATYALKTAYKQLFSLRSSDEDPDAKEHDAASGSERKPEQQSAGNDSAKSSFAGDKQNKKEDFDAAVTAIKTRYTLKDASETNYVPPWKKEFKPFLDSLIKKARHEDTRKHIGDFGLFWWTCLSVVGDDDVDNAEKVFNKGKDKLTADNAKYIAGLLAKRKSGATAQ